MPPTPGVKVAITAKEDVSKVLDAVTGRLGRFAGNINSLVVGADKLAQAFGTAGKIMAGVGIGALWFGQRQLSGLMTYNEEVLRMSKITGMSVEEVQKMRFAINQEEGDFEALTTVFIKLNAAKSKALEPPKGKLFGPRETTEASVRLGGSSSAIKPGKEILDSNTARKAFAELGISLTGANGKIKSTIDILLEMSDALQSGKSSEEELAKGMELIGIRGGKGLLPFLRTGRKNIEELFAAAEKMGLISGQQSDEIDKLGDRLRALSLPLQKLRTDLLEGIFPIITRIGDVFEAAAKKISALPKATREALAQFALFDTLKLIGLGTLLMFLPKITGLMVGLTTTTGLLQFALMALIALPLSLFLGDQIIKLWDISKGYNGVTGAVKDTRQTTEDMINSVGQGLLKAGAGIIRVGNVWLGMKANIADIKAVWLELLSLWMKFESVNPFNFYGKESRKNLQSWSEYYDKRAGLEINADRNISKLIGERENKAREMEATKFNIKLPDTLGMFKPSETPGKKGADDGEEYGNEFNNALTGALSKSSFGAEQYVPSLMSVQGNFSGSVDMATGKMKFFDTLTGAADESTAALVDLKNVLGDVYNLANMTPANKMPDVTPTLPDLTGLTTSIPVAERKGNLFGGYLHQPTNINPALVGARAQVDYQSYLSASDVAEKNYRQGMNAIHLTIYANDDKVGQAVQAELNKRL